MTSIYRPGLISKRILDVAKSVRQAGGVALDKTATEAQKKLEAVVATWVNQPAFQIIRRDTGLMLIAEITIYGNIKSVRIFGFVDRGTKPHVIKPKKPGGTLAFYGGFSPKTAFHAKFGGSGKSSGPKVFTKIVHHPGSKGRDFSGAYRSDAVIQLRKEFHRELGRRV